MFIVLIVFVLLKYLTQSLECNNLSNKRFYGNVDDKITVGCKYSGDNFHYCYISEENKICIVDENTDQCTSFPGVKFMGNIEARNCEFELEVKTLNGKFICSHWHIDL